MQRFRTHVYLKSEKENEERGFGKLNTQNILKEGRLKEDSK